MNIIPNKYDIEIVLGNIEESLDDLATNLPNNYYLEDRTENGWGQVLCYEKRSEGDMNEALNSFFEPLKQISKSISRQNGILRIAVYSNAYTCTLSFDIKYYLNLFDLTVEISVYPTSE